MITVLAVDRSDGWIFAREGETIFLLRPPYRLSERRVVSEAVVARAVAQLGYVAHERELAAWADAVAFAREQVAQQRAADGRKLPEEGVGREMLRVAPASVAERFLERVRDELLARDELDAAEKVLRALQIESPRLRESPDLARRTAELMEQVLRRREERRRQLLEPEKVFVRLAKGGHLEDVKKYAQRVASAGSMFVRRDAA